MVVEDVKVEESDVQSKNAAKKLAKEAAKAAKVKTTHLAKSCNTKNDFNLQKAEYKSASGNAAAQVETTSAEDHSAGKYGDFPLIQSQEKHENRQFVNDIRSLQKHENQTIWLRGRVHTSRSKGKQCFLVLRKQSSTVQCVIIVDEQRSKQMVKFCGKYV